MGACINGIGITDWDYEGEVVAAGSFTKYIYISVESVVAEVLAALYIYVVDFGREINFLGIIFAL